MGAEVLIHFGLGVPPVKRSEAVEAPGSRRQERPRPSCPPGARRRSSPAWRAVPQAARRSAPRGWRSTSTVLHLFDPGTGGDALAIGTPAASHAGKNAKARHER